MSPIPESLGTRRITGPRMMQARRPSSQHGSSSALGEEVWLGGRGGLVQLGGLASEARSPAIPACLWTLSESRLRSRQGWVLRGVWVGSIQEVCPLEKGPPSYHAWGRVRTRPGKATARRKETPPTRLSWKAARVGNKVKPSSKNGDPWEHPTSVRDKNKNCEIGAS